MEEVLSCRLGLVEEAFHQGRLLEVVSSFPGHLRVEEEVLVPLEEEVVLIQKVEEANLCQLEEESFHLVEV